MNPHSFWISQDGVIVAQRDKSATILELTVAFQSRDREELEFLRTRLEELNFSERSRLARSGVELFKTGRVRIKKDQLIATAEAFVIDKSFPSYRCFRKLLRPGIAVGRLFYAPEAAKLNSSEIWDAIRSNQIKLPNTLSIDRFGKVHFTPHRRVYTLPDHVSELDLIYLVNGERPRSYLDKIQNAREVENLSILPGAGILTSCSMYLPHHYAVLKRANDNFGLHTSAVLLDPQKTFGSNVMLEIYNASSEMVVNPVVSIEIFKAPPDAGNERKALEAKRQIIFEEAGKVFQRFASQPKATAKKVRPRAEITLRGQGPDTHNASAVLSLHVDPGQKTMIDSDAPAYETLAEAFANSSPEADTAILTYFPNLAEHIEILSRTRKQHLKRIIFRRASHNNRFFLPNAAHAQLDAYDELGLDVYWHNEDLNELYLHAYKRNRGFFIKEDLVRQFQASTILAFYGSGVTLKPEDQQRIETLIHRMVEFFGSSIGILTGGGDGAMAVATAAGRERNCLTGACFLELEAQLPNFNVDFFNSFQETSRHNRQKWFEVADYCIFNIGGVGTLEEVGIELCNLKLGIRPRAPMVFFSDYFWSHLQEQVEHMVKTKRTPAWVAEYLLFSNNPEEIIQFYRTKLQIL